MITWLYLLREDRFLTRIPLTPEETLLFLNNYYIFKKICNLGELHDLRT